MARELTSLIQGLGSDELRAECERVKFRVRGSFDEQEVQHAIVFPNLNLPKQSVNKEIAHKVYLQQNIKIEFFQDAQITILIGQDNWPLLNIMEVRKISNTGLVISRTILGWSVHGYIDGNESKNTFCGVLTCLKENESRSAG